MNLDEGYIKFQCEWEETDPLPEVWITDLNAWRQRMYVANLVGAYPDGIGFGNVSQRLQGDRFVISGSKTGNYPELGPEHYALVETVDILQNRVSCKGATIASSESMSHAVIYQLRPEVQAVFHVHHLELWEKVLYKIPTTDPAAPYGSPEMAFEIQKLFKTTDVDEQCVFAMAGHREGLFGFGKNLDEAGNILLKLLRTYLS